MIKLKEKQNQLFKEAIKIEENKISLFEAPVGFGKSVVAIATAEHIVKNSKKKVIIATPTNQLAFEYYETLTKDNHNVGCDKKLSHTIILGLEQYFDVSKISELELAQFMNIESLNKYLKKAEQSSNTADYLFENLFAAVYVEDDLKQNVINLIKRTSPTMLIKEDFENADIIVTNFYYLISKGIYDKNVDFSNYVLIADEVHQVVEIAEQIITSTFSLYRYANLLSNLSKVKFQNKQTNTKIDTLLKKTNTLLETHSSESMAGRYMRTDDTSPFITELKSSGIGGFDKKTLKEIETVSATNEKSKSIAKMFSQELGEFKSIVSSEDTINIYYSPSRGYPKLTASFGDVKLLLSSIFWSKYYCCIGLSATIKTRADDVPFSRLGIIDNIFQYWLTKATACAEFVKNNNALPSSLSKNEEEKRLGIFLDNQKENASKGWMTSEKHSFIQNNILNNFFKDITITEFAKTKERVKYIKNGVFEYPSSFDTKKCKIYLPSVDLIPPQDQDSKNYQEWVDMVAQKISEYHQGKNSLVIVNSFFDVDNIVTSLRKIRINENLHFARRTESTSRTLERFKKEGGILVGTSNYGTGLNLPGKLLEKLFIVKLPFSVPTIKKWLDIKETDRMLKKETFYYQYIDDMILNFRQRIGRLIRTENDSGDIYILDSRINSNNYKNRLFYYLEKVGVIQDDMIRHLKENSSHYEIVKKEIIRICEDKKYETVAHLITNKIEQIIQTKTVPVVKQDDIAMIKLYRELKAGIKKVLE